MLYVIFFAFCNICVIFCHKYGDYEPQQIHLAFGTTTEEIIVSWATNHKTKETLVKYGINNLEKRASGTANKFKEGHLDHEYFHKVHLKNLKPNTTYVYMCGSKEGWSDEFHFKLPPNNKRWQPSFLVYGDLGLTNGISIPNLIEETKTGLYDAVLHAGDIAYNMYEETDKLGNEFMNKIQPIAAYLPYMTCPGNHEQMFDFANYRARFAMPNNPDKMYYAINLGPIRFVSITTDHYYFLKYGIKPLVEQYIWLENELKTANAPENRKKRPWLIVMGHRPMYCNIRDPQPCNKEHAELRVGLFGLFGLEKLFYKNQVDLYVVGHVHAYQRLWPVYDRKVMNGSFEEPYVNPKVPVHITTGAAGCRERLDTFLKDPEWSAFKSREYGYSRLKVYNRTHLCMEQVASPRKEVIDKFCIVKDHSKLN